jgi:hypothetical protein
MDSLNFQILCQDTDHNNVELFNDIKFLLSYHLDLQVNAAEDTHNSALFNRIECMRTLPHVQPQYKKI